MWPLTRAALLFFTASLAILIKVHATPVYGHALFSAERVPHKQAANFSPTSSVHFPSNLHDSMKGLVSSGQQSLQKRGDGFLGVFLGDVNEERSRDLKLKEIRGVIIGKVEEGSPAARAGLQENDVILDFNDNRVQNRSQLYRMIVDSRPGTRVTLGISRAGELMRIAVDLGQRRTSVRDERQRLFGESEALAAAAEDRRREAVEMMNKGDVEAARRLFDEEKMFRSQSEERRAFVEEQIKEGKIPLTSGIDRPEYGVSPNRYNLGLSVSPLSEQLTRYFNAPPSSLLITEVRAGGAAEQAGIKAGDCLISIDGQRVSTASDVNLILDRAGTGKDGTTNDKKYIEMIFAVVRDQKEIKLPVRFDRK